MTLEHHSRTNLKTALFLALGVLMALNSGCGVKGDPLPPLTPPEIGRGQPTFRRATEDITLPNVPDVDEYPATTNPNAKKNNVDTEE